MSSKPCCQTSVGILIWDTDRRELLMIERNTLPAGIAPVAGHALDEHTSYEAAARAEVTEEIGLEVTGHTWRLFEATVTGALAPSPTTAPPRTGSGSCTAP